MHFDRHHCDKTDLIEHLKHGATAICANQRLAAYLKESFTANMLADGKAAWETPGIYAASTWLLHTCSCLTEEHAVVSPRVIDQHQMRFIWQQILRDSDHIQQIQHVAPLLNEALQAWKTINDYCIPVTYPASRDHVDAKAFSDWLREYLGYCQTHSVIDEYQIPQYVHDVIIDRQIQLEQTIILVGFDSLTAVMVNLFECLIQKGTAVMHYADDSHESIKQLCQYPSLEDEIRASAVWARESLLQKSEQTIAIIVPDLKSLRNDIVAVFEDVLEEGRNTRFEEDVYHRAFNVSIGESLLDAPLVSTVCDLLKLTGNTINRESLHRLLLSPCINFDQDSLPLRHHIASQLHSSLSDENWLFRLSGMLADMQGSAGGLFTLLKQTIEMAGRARHRLPADEMQAWIFELLTLWQWPVKDNLDSQAYQQWQKINEILSGLQTVIGLQDGCTLSEVSTYIEMTARTTIFQPETAAAKIQIMGVLEAAGLHFDRAWLLGFTEGNWPPAVRRTPFIPFSVQHEYQVNDVYPEVMLELHRGITTRLTTCAPDITISFAAHNGDEELQPTSLIDLEPEACLPPDFESLDKRIARTIKTEAFTDDTAPAVSPDERLRGGVKILSLQAECPFHAFAEIRLNTSPDEEVLPGYDTRIRGTLMHKVVETFWKQIGTQDALLSLDQTAREKTAESSVSTAIAELSGMLPGHVSTKILDIEKDRLRDLLLRSLDVDEKRDAFTVLNVEQALPVDINGLRMTLRIDRVDVDEHGHYLLIDYKSTAQSKKDYFAERLFVPQLPVYAVYSEYPVEAIATQQIRASKCELAGIASDKVVDTQFTPLEKINSDAVPADWETLKIQWRTTIESLATEFMSGIASVTPLPEANACQYCNLYPVCRIYEQQGEPYDVD